MEELVEIVPGVGVGALRFGMRRGEVERVLGPPAQVTGLDADRALLGYVEVDALVHASLGLVAVTLSRGPVLLRGLDVFSLPRERLLEELAARTPVEARPLGAGDEVISAPGLHFYFDRGEVELKAVEVFTGAWREGRPAPR